MAIVDVQQSSLTSPQSLITRTSYSTTGASASTSDPPPSLPERSQDPSNSPVFIPFASSKASLHQAPRTVIDEGGDSATDHSLPVAKRRRRGKFVK
eukprot:CAMPEP_0177764582 /NCGR_PEP_ID=MMETSP0491_2-20121128/7481_1 /TAXON_ID=63592 /ORGANISM="Tetraselmis chuii, Strain PLY429" /LENGTH=95 /DNA_ID=CAMNT_0019280765 /DNA_START=90 /DNA_END=377 /DNA_ORIENTATION=-